jgi:hypothetical protein
VTTSISKSPRVTIKLWSSTFEQLKEMRKATGEPISVLMNRAVHAYAYPRPGVKRTRVRRLRGSR